MSGWTLFWVHKKVYLFWETLFRRPYTCTKDTSIQTFQYKIIHSTLPYNEWLHNIKINENNICPYGNNKDTITLFLIDCTSTNQFWKSWVRWWQYMTGFNIREENNIHKAIPFGFLGNNDNAIGTNYCI